MNPWWTILRIALEVIRARTNNRAVDTAAAALRIVSAAREAYRQQAGRPLDEALVPRYEPLPDEDPLL